MNRRISTTLWLALVIAIAALFTANEAYSSCTFTTPGKNKNDPGDTFTIESVYSEGQLYFPCGRTVEEYTYTCPEGDPDYLVAAWRITSLNGSKLSAIVINVPTGLLDPSGSNWETQPSGSHFCQAGDASCFYPSTVYDTLEFSFQSVEDRMVIYFKTGSDGAQDYPGQLVASYSGDMYLCEGEFSTPGLALPGIGLQTTEEIKTITQKYQGQNYSICLRTVKNEFELCPPPDQVYYACLPESGDCNDVADDAWCAFTPVLGPDGKPQKEPAEIVQYAGEPRCTNALVAAKDAAFQICYADTKTYPGCLDGPDALEYTGTLGNPCATNCIECVFGGYPTCACW